MQQIVTSETTVKGPVAFSDVLPQPATRLGFYRDIAALAFPLPPAERTAMKDFSAKASLSTGEDPGTKLTDGDTSTYVTLPLPTSEHPQHAQLEFAQPFKARTLKIIGARRLPQPSGVVQVSDDGANFRDLRTFSVGKRSSLTVALTQSAESVAARFWRVKFTSASANNGPIELADLLLSGASAIGNLEAKAGFDGNTVPAAASFSALSPDEVIKQAAIFDLTSRLQPDGRLRWDAPAGEWLVLRVGYTPTARNNHPAPPEATGLECDKFSRQALDLHWAGFMQKIIADAGPLAGKSFNNALIDSYEVGGQNWSPAFREEFRKRRGYDLLRFLPSFSGRVVDSPEITERFLWDMRRTNFRELCRQNGLLASIEPYTGPFESLQCGAAADLVMGEFWSNSQGHPSVKLASSVAHIYGKTIVGAESFTGNPNNAGKWLEDPYSLKALGDLMYCWGLNRFIFHRYAMQPWTNRWPGMTMGQWGFHFDRTSTWWEQGRAWIEYCTRCQFLLQQGHSVADVAYFCGESAPVEMRSGHPPLPNGYDYDAINADVLLHHASVQEGRLTLDGGASYRVLVLPPDDPAITPRLLKRIRDLVRAGLIVLGAPPAHSPSLEDFPRCDAQVKALAAEMWGEIAARDRVAADVSRRTISEERLAPTDVGGYTATEHACGRGKVAWNKSLEEVLAEAGEKPDFEFSSGSPEAKLVYVHRADKGADIYFGLSFGIPTLV